MKCIKVNIQGQGLGVEGQGDDVSNIVFNPQASSNIYNVSLQRSVTTTDARFVGTEDNMDMTLQVYRKLLWILTTNSGSRSSPTHQWVANLFHALQISLVQIRIRPHGKGHKLRHPCGPLETYFHRLEVRGKHSSPLFLLECQEGHG